MTKEDRLVNMPDETIMHKIYLIRNQKVMLDQDLAELYGVETKQLKRAVRRNIGRFPDDFMFELNQDEFADLRSQFGTSSWGGSRYVPMAFTEHGVLMLSSVLNSDQAIKVNIQIMRIFTKMREMLSSHNEILKKLNEMEGRINQNDDQIMLIFEYIKQLEEAKKEELTYKNRRKIGYKRPDED